MPLADYAFISDCHSSALVSRDGSIDWCCMPRIDSRSCFARLLGREAGGYCSVSPIGAWRVERNYRADSLVLETTFRTDRGAVRVVDCLPMRKGGRQDPYLQIIRVVEGLEGEVSIRVDVVPRFDYGAIKPWIKAAGRGVFHAIGGSDGMLISTDLPLRGGDRHALACKLAIFAGERHHLSMIHVRPADLEDGRVSVPTAAVVFDRVKETERWWRRWAEQGRKAVFDPELSRRSAVVLKGLTHAPTGAIAAAATTSLPESAGGSRNWDYRLSWVRDSVFTVRSLLALGYENEADGFRRFVERSAAGNAEQVQVLYGVDGRRRLSEQIIRELPGFDGAAPVRIGNAAAGQLQLDVFGELLDLAYLWHQLGNSPDAEYREFLVSLVERTIAMWRQPDQGLWEMRGPARHFVYSKVMCWAALDRGIRLVEELDQGTDDLQRWSRERDAVRAAVESRGYDAERGVFTQAFESPELDASLLLLPVARFVEFSDERMVRTTDAVRDELTDHGLLRRYRAESDGMKGREVYASACSTSNDLGLFSEEYDTENEVMLGNFPQGLTHLSQISAAVAMRGLSGAAPGSAAVARQSRLPTARRSGW